MKNLEIARLTFTTIVSAFNADVTDLNTEELNEKYQEIIDHLDENEDGKIDNLFEVENEVINTDCDNFQALTMLTVCANATDSDFNDFELYEILDLIDSIKNSVQTEDDFSIDDLPCGEVRVICKDAIDEIWTDSLIDMIKDCYEGLSDLPSFVSIDWVQTAENCKVDGLGHHFAGYDHEEHESGNFHIFRTN
jgi:hypothetical protein